MALHKQDYSSDWLGEMGAFNSEDVPEAVRRLLISTSTGFA
jgi:hypothetical protein